ncbi:MAG: DNA polymerase IV [Gammaproteobacteria bacterium]|nr:DNA polymerase IV [Gammaproteobacteria bacterium]MDH3537325.1 DNA polymerase IV [Gammaproteobacteria bacterium]
MNSDAKANRKIIHIDADCFYAAVEIRDNPSLRGKPIAVGGSATRRGVIATASYEARKFGVHSAMASATAVKRCPQLILIPGRMSVYREASRQMHEIFADYTDLIEPLSLDEAFLDVSSCTRCRGSATLIAEEIRRRIADDIGITVSAGIAPNKFIAKVASDWNKPDGQYVVTPLQVDDFLESLPVKRIWGVGKVTAERLETQDIKTCGDVRRYDIYRFVQQFGQFGEHIYKLAHGIDNRPVVAEWRRKSVSVENTYDEDLPDLDSCRQHIPALIESLQLRLQRLDEDYRIHNCFLKMKFFDFSQTTVERQQTEPNYADYAMLCEEAWKRGRKPVRLLGIGTRLIDLTDASGQMDLFED